MWFTFYCFYNRKPEELSSEEKDDEIQRLRDENKELKRYKQENERQKTDFGLNKFSPKRRNLPIGLELQSEDSIPRSSSFGRVKCNEKGCNECEHIQDPLRHFLEKINPILDKCDRDINKISKISVTQCSENDYRRFNVEYPEEELKINSSAIKHFKECHLCYLYWNHSILDICSISSTQKKCEQRRKGKKWRLEKRINCCRYTISFMW